MANALYADDPAARLAAAAHLSRRCRRTLTKESAGWPPDSPGAVNAWALFVTTKPPTWRDPYVTWRDAPLTIGEPHEGFFYPDPLGFWAEVRHWAATLAGLPITDALSVSALLHGIAHLERALQLMRPQIVLFLDEPAWRTANLPVRAVARAIPDPYREGQVYEGWWGHTPEGFVLGKAPQHPAAHRLYARSDMDGWLSWPSRTARS
jgi:hypothetical protein